MKTKLLIAGMLLTSVTAFAAADDGAPEICKSAANYTAQTLARSYEDGNWGDKDDPNQQLLNKDYSKFPITKVTFLGNCDEDNAGKLKESWCRVGGGSPDVFEIEVSQVEEGYGTYPLADVIVTYNRGGCHVDEATRK